MIKNIIDLLQVDEYYKVSKDVDIAKGKYLKPRNLSEVKELIKRTING